MREFIETINEMGIKGVLGWFKRLFVAMTLLEFIGYSVYWLVTVGALSKLVLISIPVAAIVVTAIEDLVKEKDICDENEEVEEEEVEEA